jgi:hypothetical protein
MSVIIDVYGPRPGSFGYSGPAYRKILASTLEGLTDPEDRHEVERAQGVQLLIIGGDESSLRIAAAMLDGAKRLTEEVTASPTAKSDAFLAKSLPDLTAALEAFLEAPDRGVGEPIPPVEDLASEREGWVQTRHDGSDRLVFPGWAYRRLLESTIEELASASDIEAVNLGWWYKEFWLAAGAEAAGRIATAMRDAAARIAAELDHNNHEERDRLLELRQTLDAFIAAGA